MEPAHRTNPKSDFFTSAASICGGVVASLGMLGFFAWISGLHILSSISPAYIPMAPDTAVIFATLGLSLVLAARRMLPHPGRAFLALIAAFASVYGLLKFVEYFVKVDLTFESGLFPVADQLGSFPINRMSPITGALFLLCGIALALILWGKWGDHARSLIGGLGILVFSAGFVATTGYLFATPLLYGGDITPLAATTASAFLLLGIGLVAAAGPADIFVHPLVGSSVRARMLRAFLPLTAMAVLVQGILQEIITRLSDLNHALLSAVFSLIFVAITAVVVTQVARVISHSSEVAEVERKKAEEDLLKFKLGIERSDAAIFVTDANGIIVYINPGFEKIYGYTREQALGRTPRILKSGVLSRGAYDHFWKTLLAKQVVTVELINRTRDGRLLNIEGSANPILSDGGDILGFLAIQRDITRRKQVEEALERSQATLAQAGQMTHLGAWEIEISKPEDLNANPLRWSDEVYRIFGYEPGAVEVTNDLFFQHVHPEDRLCVVQAVSQAIAEKRAYSIEHRIVRPDRTERIVSEHAEITFDPQGRPTRMLGAVQDITERKRTEEMLAKERNILRTLIDSIPDYIYVKDTESRFVAGNLAIAHSFGKATPEEIYGQNDFDFHAPELAIQFRADEEGIFRTGQPLINREEFVIEPAGNQKWLITTKLPLRDSQGKIVGLVGVGRDITERRRAEQALKASEQYARNIIDSSLDMIITVDRERRIVEFNRAAETAFGYARDKILGKHISLLYADSAEGQTVHQTTFEEGNLVREILNRRRNGEVFPSLLSAAVMRDGKGEPIGVVGVSRDITEARRAEEALRRRLAELGALHTVAAASVEAPDEDTLIERATRVVGENLFPDNFGVLLLDHSRSCLRVHPSYRADMAIKDRIVPLHQGITGQVAATGTGIRCGDVSNQPGYLRLDARIRSELCVPLRVGDRLLGVMNAESARSFAFTDADERLLVTLASQLASAIDRLRTQAELRRLATIDELTGVFNRRYFFELARREFDRCQRLGHPMSAIMVDIDHFKAVNDKHGHAVGDQVLRAVVASCLKDIREIDLLGRYGGEEFTILLVECDQSYALHVAERLRASIAGNEIPTTRGPVSVTVSLGLAQLNIDTKDITALIESADAAMYAAKAAGRNRVAVG